MTHSEVISVSAAMIRCDLMWQGWDEHRSELLNPFPGLAQGDIRANDSIMVEPASSYLILGVALLFVVIEFLRDHCVPFPDAISSDIETLYPKLKEFRNCVFHTQGKLLSERQFALMDAPDSLGKLRKIHAGVSSMLRSMVASLPPSAFQYPEGAIE